MRGTVIFIIAQALADTFVNLAPKGYDEASHAVRGAGLDVLLEMQVHTLGSRLQIISRRPAPTQVSPPALRPPRRLPPPPSSSRPLTTPPSLRRAGQLLGVPGHLRRGVLGLRRGGRRGGAGRARVRVLRGDAGAAADLPNLLLRPPRRRARRRRGRGPSRVAAAVRAAHRPRPRRVLQLQQGARIHTQRAPLSRRPVYDFCCCGPSLPSRRWSLSRCRWTSSTVPRSRCGWP